MRVINGQCIFVDPGCRGRDCLPVSVCADGRPRNSDGNCPIPTPSCPAATVLVNGACCNIRDYNAGRCGPPPPGIVTTCAFPQLLVNGTCCTRESITAGTCGATNVKCRPGSPGCPVLTRDCPGGATRVDGRCPAPNTGGGCGPNQFRGDNGKCQNTPKPTDPGKKPTDPGRTPPKCAGRIDSSGNCVTGTRKPPVVTNPGTRKPPVISNPGVRKPPGLDYPGGRQKIISNPTFPKIAPGGGGGGLNRQLPMRGHGPN
jgi:hypothetical protein